MEINIQVICQLLNSLSGKVSNLPIKLILNEYCVRSFTDVSYVADFSDPIEPFLQEQARV